MNFLFDEDEIKSEWGDYIITPLDIQSYLNPNYSQ